MMRTGHPVGSASAANAACLECGAMRNAFAGKAASPGLAALMEQARVRA
jgi:hypothetical protein